MAKKSLRRRLDLNYDTRIEELKTLQKTIAGQHAICLRRQETILKQETKFSSNWDGSKTEPAYGGVVEATQKYTQMIDQSIVTLMDDIKARALEIKKRKEMEIASYQYMTSKIWEIDPLKKKEKYDGAKQQLQNLECDSSVKSKLWSYFYTNNG